jgi:hypothetical protein
VTNDDYIQNLIHDLGILDKSLYWLRRSHAICTKIGVQSAYTEDEFDAIETLTSRYARTSDIIIQKVFRSIDKVEFEESGTMIDVINRAHKRGLFDSIDEIRMIKDLRNKIAHEYAKEDIESVFAQVLNFTPEIFTLAARILAYCSRYDQAESLQ